MNSREVLSRPAAGPDLVLRYADHAGGVIDVFEPRVGDEDPPQAGRPSPLPGVDSLGGDSPVRPRPTRQPARLVVFLHGGFWREEWDRVHVRPLAWALSAAGHVVAVPEYRRGPGSWPSMSADVEAALASVRRDIASALPGLLEPDAPYLLAGHSAGGHLALWAGLRAGPRNISHIVALAPVSDVRYAAEVGMGDGAVADLLGGSEAQQPAAYAEADVLPLLPPRAPPAVPVTLVQGDRDQQVAVEMNRAFAQRVPADTPAPFRYIELAGVGHFELIDPESDAWPTVLATIDDQV